MALFSIWSEGYIVTETGHMATRVGNVPCEPFQLNADPVEAESFDDAVLQYISQQPADERNCYHQDIVGQWRCWGSKLHPDEESANQSTFGQ